MCTKTAHAPRTNDAAGQLAYCAAPQPHVAGDAPRAAAYPRARNAACCVAWRRVRASARSSIYASRLSRLTPPLFAHGLGQLEPDSEQASAFTHVRPRGLLGSHSLTDRSPSSRARVSSCWSSLSISTGCGCCLNWPACRHVTDARLGGDAPLDTLGGATMRVHSCG